jgi:hypothetical protein
VVCLCHRGPGGPVEAKQLQLPPIHRPAWLIGQICQQ